MNFKAPFDIHFCRLEKNSTNNDGICRDSNQGLPDNTEVTTSKILYK